MNIFLSWAGDQSRVIADTVYSWLPKVIQAVDFFYSPNIEKGADWKNELDTALGNIQFGIVCLTRENRLNHWIHYEVGALNKRVEGKICTFRYRLTPAEVLPPLSQYQGTNSESRDDVLKMIQSINNHLATPLKPDILLHAFNREWPDLEKALKDVNDRIPSDQGEQLRDDREILEEILEIVRVQQVRISQLEHDVLTPNRLSRVPIDHVMKVDQPMEFALSGKTVELAHGFRDAPEVILVTSPRADLKGGIPMEVFRVVAADEDKDKGKELKSILDYKPNKD